MVLTSYYMYLERSFNWAIYQLQTIFKQLTLFRVKTIQINHVIILDFFALQEAATISNTTWNPTN